MPCPCPRGHCPVGKGNEAWPQHDLGGSQHGQAGAAGFMGSWSQSSPTASRTDDKAYNIAPPRRQTRRVEAGFQKENWGRAGQAAGKEER